MSRLSNEYESFSEKTVIELHCKYCDRCLSSRGMMANLIADVSVELYSTDLPEIDNVLLVGKVYTAETCFCNISDVACIGCGNVVGYHVTKPCTSCLSSCNNGHFWMFLSEASYQYEKVDTNGFETLKWESLRESQDETQNGMRNIKRSLSEECQR